MKFVNGKRFTWGALESTKNGSKEGKTCWFGVGSTIVDGFGENIFCSIYDWAIETERFNEIAGSAIFIEENWGFQGARCARKKTGKWKMPCWLSSRCESGSQLDIFRRFFFFVIIIHGGYRETFLLSPTMWVDDNSRFWRVVFSDAVGLTWARNFIKKAFWLGALPRSGDDKNSSEHPKFMNEMPKNFQLVLESSISRAIAMWRENSKKFFSSTSSLN